MKKTPLRLTRRAPPPGFAALAPLLLAATLLGAADARAADGAIAGQVYDGKTGAPLAGATVVVTWPAPPGGSTPRQETRETGADGTFELSVPEGSYHLAFRKPGYSDSEVATFAVRPGQKNRADQ